MCANAGSVARKSNNAAMPARTDMAPIALRGERAFDCRQAPCSCADLEGDQEGVFLVDEVLVEGDQRDGRLLGDLFDAQRRVALARRSGSSTASRMRSRWLCTTKLRETF